MKIYAKEMNCTFSKMDKGIERLINKACIEYFEQVDSVYNEKDIFSAGAEFGYNLCLSKWQEAERWRKVEEELPEVFGAGTSIPVLVKTKYGTYHVAVYSKPHDDFIEIPYSVAGVTEWKPIS